MVTALSQELYRQYIPDLKLSIERATSAVPGDGRYHIVNDGKIIASYRSLRRAQEAFNAIVRESGYKPKKAPSEKKVPESIERYLDAKEMYWADSYRYRGGGGKGGRGGV